MGVSGVLEVFVFKTLQNSATCVFEHFQKWPKKLEDVLACGLSIGQQHSRIFVRRPIDKAWERLKGSRLCERCFVDILLEQADLTLWFSFSIFRHSIRFSLLRYAL